MGDGAERLGAAIRAARGRRSVRSLARKAGTSDTRWRQAEQGWQPVGSGQRIPVRLGLETLCRIATTVGLDPYEALGLGERGDEREALAQLLAEGPERPEAMLEEAIDTDPRLGEGDKRVLRAALAEMLSRG